MDGYQKSAVPCVADLHSDTGWISLGMVREKEGESDITEPIRQARGKENRPTNPCRLLSAS